MLKKPALLICGALLTTYLLNASDAERNFTQEEPSENTYLQPSRFEPFTGIINGSKVRMRVQPSLDALVVRETSNGEMFAVLGQTADYYAVQPPKGMKGYIFRTFFLDGVIEGDRVNVRLSPDIEAPIVARLNTGDRVQALPVANSKWLEIDLPESSRFFIAKEYIDNIGGVELVALFEKKKLEATHYLTAATLFAQSEVQKPFEQIDYDRIQSSFESLNKDYRDLPAVCGQIKETSSLIQEIYLQKKIAFLEGKASGKTPQLDHLAKLTSQKPYETLSSNYSKAATFAGLATCLGEQATDKMLAWQPLEESIYHTWVASEGEKSLEEFYSQENPDVTILTGIVEPYNRPVKNRPGDFLLKMDNLPVAFLYSTKVNLEKLVGQQVTLIAAPRPNHHFAFPAYFVLNIQ